MFFFDPIWFVFALRRSYSRCGRSIKYVDVSKIFAQVPNVQQLGGRDVARVLMRK